MNWKHFDQTSAVSIDSAPANDSAFPAFAPLISDAFEHIKNLPPRIEIPTGTTLLYQGEACQHVYLLLGGLVKIVSTNSEGRDATLGLRASGWYSGASFVITRSLSVYSVITLTKCELIKVPAEQFPSLLMQSSKLMRHFTMTLCNELISQSLAQVEVMISSAEERLATFMRERLHEGSQGKLLDALPFLRQAELAKLLSISPEHLSRLLHKNALGVDAERRRA